MFRCVFIRNFVFAIVTLILGVSLAKAQGSLGVPVTLDSQPKDSANKVEPAPTSGATIPFVLDAAKPSRFDFMARGESGTGFLTGNTSFPNFIGFSSNPIQSIDPRAVTEIVPMYGSAWASGNNSFLPDGNVQVFGPGLTVALSDRLSVGLNQGGYGVANFSNDRERRRAALGLPVRDRDRGGQREGWLNLGGFVQYTLIADVPNQFLVTAGIRTESTLTGSTQLFQGGAGPWYLAPYLTVGKEFGCWHVLATTGYEFPAGSGDATTNTFYANVHIDRQIGWLYPLVELNGAYHTSSANLIVDSPRHGVIDLGTFSSTGNTLTAAVGANAVLIPGKLELGAVYIRPVTSQGRFDFNGMLVKMVYRY